MSYAKINPDSFSDSGPIELRNHGFRRHHSNLSSRKSSPVGDYNYDSADKSHRNLKYATTPGAAPLSPLTKNQIDKPPIAQKKDIPEGKYKKTFIAMLWSNKPKRNSVECESPTSPAPKMPSPGINQNTPKNWPTKVEQIQQQNMKRSRTSHTIEKNDSKSATRSKSSVSPKAEHPNVLSKYPLYLNQKEQHNSQRPSHEGKRRHHYNHPYHHHQKNHVPHAKKSSGSSGFVRYGMETMHQQPSLAVEVQAQNDAQNHFYHVEPLSPMKLAPQHANANIHHQSAQMKTSKSDPHIP